MENIITMTFEELTNIIRMVFVIIKDDLIFPTGPRSIEDQISYQIKGQNSMIHSQQDRLFHQTGVIQDQNHQIVGLKDLIAQKDKEIEHLNQQVKSLEF